MFDAESMPACDASQLKALRAPRAGSPDIDALCPPRSPRMGRIALRPKPRPSALRVINTGTNTAYRTTRGQWLMKHPGPAAPVCSRCGGELRMDRVERPSVPKGLARFTCIVCGVAQLAPPSPRANEHEE
jgi:hypothetical protein